MTTEQFREFTDEVIPQQLFHVEPKDRDDKTGGRLDETILVGLIANRPACLKHKPLQWFLDRYLISEKEWDEMMEKNEAITKRLSQSQKEEQKLFHDILEAERDICPNCMGSGEIVFGGSFGGASHHTICLMCKGTGLKK